MHERTKLAEARYFLDRLHAEVANPAAFGRELSAFLASARSVLQYALKEAESKPGGRQWYEQAVAADPLFRFFKNERDTNIHDQPVDPARRSTTEVASLLNIADDGEEEFLIPYPHSRTLEHYEFQGRPGESVLDSARRYLGLLDTFVAQGTAGGWIAG